MTDFQCDAVVIGAGVAGLAVARALALAGLETVILEKNAGIGLETSARNSGVIHAGIYYPRGSLKARLCVEGRGLLYDFCASHGVPHRRTGKWLVAVTPEEENKLHALRATAVANGVEDLAWIADGTARALEPALRSATVLESPSTGILDSHAYMLALLGDAEGAGASLVGDARVERIAKNAAGFRLYIRNAGTDTALQARLVVNSAGLWAQQVARATEGLAAETIPPLHLAKGHYAAISGAVPFGRLIYPMPDAGGLGVHLTLDMGGQGQLGPDAVWLDHADPARIAYDVPQEVTQAFADRVRGWWPDVRADRLTPAYAGVRPRIVQGAQGDFRIDGPAVHGLPGLVNLFGIESPGLTASLAIGRHVAALLDG